MHHVAEVWDGAEGPKDGEKNGGIFFLKWVWVNTYRYIFSGMNIHLPAILGFTRYQGFDPSPNLFQFVLLGDPWSVMWPYVYGIIIFPSIHIFQRGRLNQPAHLWSIWLIRGRQFSWALWLYSGPVSECVRGGERNGKHEVNDLFGMKFQVGVPNDHPQLGFVLRWLSHDFLCFPTVSLDVHPR